jgi:3-oxoacyl-[acyl-carrier protein] reductase
MGPRQVVVVGSRGGIGSVVRQRFASTGDEVVGLDRESGVDACDPDAVAEALEGVEPDVLVHVAGSVGRGGIEDHTVADWRRVLDDNLTSSFVICQAVVPGMRARGRGAIVLTSSVMGRHGGNRLSGPAYASAKSAVIGLTHHLAKDLAADGIRVNAIAPGPVNTPMVARLSDDELRGLLDQVPLRRVAEPDEIAAAVEYLCSDMAASITGTVLDINGGMWLG